MSLYVTDGGIERANPEARDTNFLRLQKCDPTASPCLDYYEGAQAGTDTMVSVTIDGTAYPLTTTTTLSQVGVWKAEIEALLADGTPEEINVIVRAAHDGTDLSFEHQGVKVISAITTSGGAIALTRECAWSGHADYTISVSGAATQLSDGTNSAALATGTYSWTGTPATDTATAATLKGDIETALGALTVSFVEVTVKVDNVNSEFDVTIHRKKDGTLLYLDTTMLSEGGYVVEWDNGALKV